MSNITLPAAQKIVDKAIDAITGKQRTIDTGFNKIIDVCSDHSMPRPIRGSLLVRRTTQYCAPKTAGNLILPADSQADMHDKKMDIGEVISIGSEVKEIKVGDIVVYQRNAAMRLPSGLKDPFIFKLEETPIAIICVLPPQPEKDRQVFTTGELARAANQVPDRDAVQFKDAEDRLRMALYCSIAALCENEQSDLTALIDFFDDHRQLIRFLYVFGGEALRVPTLKAITDVHGVACAAVGMISGDGMNCPPGVDPVRVSRVVGTLKKVLARKQQMSRDPDGVLRDMGLG